MKLSDYYLELIFSIRRGGWLSFSTSNVTTWLQVNFGLGRAQARKIARILWGWVWFGYAPASLVEFGS